MGRNVGRGDELVYDGVITTSLRISSLVSTITQEISKVNAVIKYIYGCAIELEIRPVCETGRGDISLWCECLFRRYRKTLGEGDWNE